MIPCRNVSQRVLAIQRWRYENGLICYDIFTNEIKLYTNFRTVFEEVNQEAKGKLETSEKELMEELER